MSSWFTPPAIDLYFLNKQVVPYREIKGFFYKFLFLRVVASGVFGGLVIRVMYSSVLFDLSCFSSKKKTTKYWRTQLVLLLLASQLAYQVNIVHPSLCK